MRDLPVRVRDMACVKIKIVQNVPFESKTNNLLHDNIFFIGRNDFLFRNIFIFIRDMFHNISEVTVKNRTEVVKSVNFDIQVMAELIQQRTADAIAGIQIILRDSALLHCFPEFVVTYHL